MRFHTLLCAVAILGITGLGCGNQGPRRFHLTGKVTYGGQSVPAGQIFFDPDVSKNNDGPAGFAFIKNGSFDTRLDGRQHIGGPHQIRIQAFDGKPGSELPLGRMMAPEYTTSADLPSENGQRDFEVPKQP